MLETNTQQLQTTHKDNDFQRTISTIIDSSPDFDAFKANLIQKFASFTAHINDNVDTLKKGFETTKKVCGEKFDIAKIKALKQTSDLYNAIKDFFVLIYNYTLGIIAGKIEYTRQQKIAAAEFSTEIKKLEGIAIAELKQQVKSKEEQIEQLETNNQTFRIEVKTLQDGLAKKQAEFSKLEKDQKEIIRLKEEIANLSKLEGENQNAILALQQQVKSKEEQIKQLETKPTLEREVKKLQDELANKQAALKKSEKDTESKKAELTNLEKTLINKQKELTNLETQIKTKKDEIEKLNLAKKTESENKKAELVKLETQIKTKKDELKANVDKELETYKETAKTEINNKKREEFNRITQEALIEKNKILDESMAGVKKQTAEVLNSNRKAEELLNQKIEKLQKEANDLEQRVQELQKTKKENTPSVLGYILGYPQRVVAAQIKQLEEKLKNDVQTCTEKEKRILEIEVEAHKQLLRAKFYFVEQGLKSGTLNGRDVKEFKKACEEIQNYVSPQKPVQDSYLVQGTKTLLSLFKANKQPQPITAQQNQQNPQSSWTDTLLCRRRQVNQQQDNTQQQEGFYEASRDL